MSTGVATALIRTLKDDARAVAILLYSSIVFNLGAATSAVLCLFIVGAPNKARHIYRNAEQQECGVPLEVRGYRTGGTPEIWSGTVMVRRESCHGPLLYSWNDMLVFRDGNLGLSPVW